MLYRFQLLRPLGNGIVDALPPDSTTLGIEVTDPALAAQCGLGNVDPQHGPVPIGKAAIEVCLDHPPPPPGSILVTLRPDLDALGAMALLAARAEGFVPGPETLARVRRVGAMDRFDRGPWPGPRPVPTHTADLAEGWCPDLRILTAAVTDQGRSLAARVATVRRWLETGAVPETYRRAVAARDDGLLAALRSGALAVTATAGGRIAVVEGPVAGAVGLGYRLAPVVVALNARFRFAGRAPHRKLTVCQYREGHVDLVAVRGALAGREPGWGGSRTVIGSPQGRGSALALDEVTTVVAAHLRP